jgi:gas vesicle protein
VIEQSVSTTLQNIQSQFGGELAALNNKLQELLAQSTALAGTVLNTSDLQLKYENLQKEFLLLKDKAQNSVVETGEILKAEVDAVVEEIKPEIEEIKTEVKKLKLKRK